MTLLKSGKGRGAISFLLPLIVAVTSLSVGGCATSQKPPVPRKTMSLTIDSIPSDAEVYSYKDGKRGVLIGTTPLEIDVGAHFDYYGTNYSVWFYSPDDCVTAERIDAPAGERYKLYLNCVILKDGYDPTYVSNRFFTICSIHYGIDFHDEKVELVYPLDPAKK